jgi:hypothetical protein
MDLVIVTIISILTVISTIVFLDKDPIDFGLMKYLMILIDIVVALLLVIRYLSKKINFVRYILYGFLPFIVFILYFNELPLTIEFMIVLLYIFLFDLYKANDTLHQYSVIF